ncbi:MAG TPA: lycopene cyclase domain-containing protein, partial [Puia sp.]|nr:lycopene cyclase domain-containing protein [Puia sp.]
MEKYFYLGLDLACILIPLAFSFYPKANFSSKWKFLWPAIGIPAILFITWDSLFTQMGVWGFNPRYVTGLYVGNLPLEEILFFICIPYACVFTYEAVNYFQKTEPLPDNGRRVTWVLIVGLLLVGMKNYDKLYTSVTCIGMAAMLAFLQLAIKPQYLARFYFAYIFILIPFFLVNGVLTGTGLPEPVVWYNDRENLGIRIMTIPFEDAFYGM